jgi:hypothetical protein
MAYNIKNKKLKSKEIIRNMKPDEYGFYNIHKSDMKVIWKDLDKCEENK